MYFSQKGEEVSLWDVFSPLRKKIDCLGSLQPFRDEVQSTDPPCRPFWLVSGWLFLLRFTDIPQSISGSAASFLRVLLSDVRRSKSEDFCANRALYWGRGDGHQALQASQLIKQTEVKVQSLSGVWRLLLQHVLTLGPYSSLLSRTILILWLILLFIFYLSVAF